MQCVCRSSSVNGFLQLRQFTSLFDQARASIGVSLFPGFFDTLEYRGNLASELSVFTSESDTSAEQRSNISLSGEVELYYPLTDEGNQSIVITPFLRLDENDAERTHFDFREFLYQYNADNWEVRVGFGKVFWGVAESRNVVDIINQRDLVEGIISDEKLGQPPV